MLYFLQFSWGCERNRKKKNNGTITRELGMVKIRGISMRHVPGIGISYFANISKGEAARYEL